VLAPACRRFHGRLADRRAQSLASPVMVNRDAAEPAGTPERDAASDADHSVVPGSRKQASVRVGQVKILDFWPNGTEPGARQYAAHSLTSPGVAGRTMKRLVLKIAPFGRHDYAEGNWSSHQVPVSAWNDQAGSGIHGWPAVSMTRASKKLRPCLAAVDR
jgi:hypothetical protein